MERYQLLGNHIQWVIIHSSQPKRPFTSYLLGVLVAKGTALYDWRHAVNLPMQTSCVWNPHVTKRKTISQSRPLRVNQRSYFWRLHPRNYHQTRSLGSINCHLGIHPTRDLSRTRTFSFECAALTSLLLEKGIPSFLLEKEQTTSANQIQIDYKSMCWNTHSTEASPNIIQKRLRDIKTPLS